MKHANHDATPGTQHDQGKADEICDSSSRLDSPVLFW
jgi:hypothetical protein